MNQSVVKWLHQWLTHLSSQGGLRRLLLKYDCILLITQFRTSDLPNFDLLPVCAHDVILRTVRAGWQCFFFCFVLFCFLNTWGANSDQMFSVIDINTYVAEAKQSRAMPEEVCRRACGPCGMGERQQMVKESVELRGREGGWEKAGVSAHHAPGISYLKFSRSAPLKPPQRTTTATGAHIWGRAPDPRGRATINDRVRRKRRGHADEVSCSRGNFSCFVFLSF